MMDGLIEDLCEITGFAGLSLQPNAGAQGEVWRRALTLFFCVL